MRILVTGGNGLVGNAIRQEKTKHQFVFITRKNADLTKEEDVEKIFNYIRPDWVIHTAAKVGGIGGNLAHAAEFFRDNILMNTHMIHCAWEFKVKKYLAFSSVCVFPYDAHILKEEIMLDGQPYEANYSYGWSKRMIDVNITAYKKQYGVKNYSSIIPGNIFGSHDLYNLQDGHVLPALIHKIWLAKQSGEPLKVWGTGESLREFIYANDLARMILQIIELDEIPQRVIISGEKQITIKELVERLVKAANFTNGIEWQTDRPNGQHARPTDLSVLKSLVDVKYTDFDEALKISYEWLEKNHEKARK